MKSLSLVTILLSAFLFYAPSALSNSASEVSEVEKAEQAISDEDCD